jgi:SSS family solute:Na+ symporter
MEIDITLTLLIFYLAIIITIGLLTSKKIKSSKSFFLADRSLGTFTLTATITATVVGGSATIATAKLIYLNGLPALWLDIGAALGLIILGLTLAKNVRKTGLFTLPEIIGNLFDEKVRFAAAFLIIITQIAWISLLIQGTGAIINVLLPFDYTITLTLITVIFIIYTILGGQFAVVYTDIIQFIIMIIGVCCLAAPLLLMQAIPMFNEISANHLSFPVNSNFGVLPMLSFFFMMLMPHIVGPDIYSKVLSAKDEKTAKYGSLLSGFFRIIFAISIALIALAATVLVPGLTEKEAVFAMPIAINLLSPWFAGPILAAFVSVMLSSADSVLISAGTILSVDITRKKNIIVSRVGIFLIGFLALGLALYLSDIISTLVLAYTVFTAGLTIPIIFGFYKKKTKVTPIGALWGLILGGITALVCFFSGTILKEYAVLPGMVISIIPLLVYRENKK